VFSLRDSENFLVLASNSPRRSALIQQIGIPFEAMGAAVEEKFLPNESPQDHVERLAGEKAASIASLRPSQWIIGADTIVLVNGQVLGKPSDPSEAVKMLGMISGRMHKVLTAFCVINKSLFARSSIVVETDVVIKDLSSIEIDAYVSTGEPMDKAGAYGAQGIGASLIREIRGSYTNVVGLPLCELAEELLRLGVIRISSDTDTDAGAHIPHG